MSPRKEMALLEVTMRGTSRLAPCLLPAASACMNFPRRRTDRGNHVGPLDVIGESNSIGFVERCVFPQLELHGVARSRTKPALKYVRTKFPIHLTSTHGR